MRYFKQVGSLILAASVCILLLGSPNLMADHPNDVAQKGFAKMKDPTFNLDFCSAEVWAMAGLGEGFPICTIKGESLLRRERTDKMMPLQSLVDETTDWYYPILSSGNPVAMLFVSKIEGKWQVSGVGHAGIAQELGEMLTAWKPSEGYSFRFVRSFEAKSDFLEIYPGQGLMRVSETDPLGYLPFLSARVALDLPLQSAQKSDLILESQFIDKLVKCVEMGQENPLNNKTSKMPHEER